MRRITKTELLKAFNQPPELAIQYFESLGITPRLGSWEEVLNRSKKRAFTVANITSTRVLEGLHNDLTRSLSQGLTQKETLDNMMSTLQKQGYSNALEPYRLKQIYRANMQTSYNAGRFIAQRSNIKSQPYMQRIAVEDGGTRLDHYVVSRMIRRADDPWWDNNYPPYLNGKFQFGCRCRVRTLSEKRVQAMMKADPNLKVVGHQSDQTADDASIADNPLFSMDDFVANELRNIQDPNARKALIAKLMERP